MRVLLLSSLLLGPMPAAAQNSYVITPDAHGRLPQCGPAMDGQAMCRSGVIYECVLNSPNSLERRSGWRWQPDLLRGCDEPSPRRAEVGNEDQGNDYRSNDGQSRAGQTELPPGFTYAPQINQSGTQPGQSGPQTTPIPGRSGRRY